MLKSTKSIIYTSFIVVGISLSVLIGLGIRQVQLNREYSDISGLSEKTLFAFSTVREQVTEALISRNEQLLKGVIPEIEELNNTISRFFDSDIIPGQYKLALTERIDLAGLVIDIRKVGSESDDPDTGLKLQQDMRLIGDNLMKIDRVITGQIRNGVVGFQLSIIGVMGLLISSLCFILILLYRRTISPLFELARQIGGTQVEYDRVDCAAEAANEIAEITDSLKRMMAKHRSAEADLSQPREDRETLERTINETANGLNGMINYSQLLLESEAQLSEKQKLMLEEIINSGERIADQWQKLSLRFST